jgi:hypothetical protein
MRALATVVAAVSIVAAIAQPHIRTEVVTVDSTSASELYTKAKRWFVDSRVALQFDDPPQYTLVGRGSFRYAPIIIMAGDSRRGDMTFRVEVICNDGGYKVIFTDYDHDARVSLGAIQADSTKCTEQLLGNFKKRVCREEVFPRIRENEAALLTTLKAALSPKSDW